MITSHKEVFALVISACLCLACGHEESTPSTKLGTPSATDLAQQQVARELQAECKKLRQSSDPYYGEFRARELSAWLRSTRTQSDPIPQIHSRRLALASEFLKMGLTETALEVLERMEPEFFEAAKTAPQIAGTSETESAPEQRRPTPEARTDPEDGGVTDSNLAVRRLALLRAAHLQLGEDQNCSLSHSAASCIVPFRDDGIHSQPEHAQRAAELSLEILEQRPDSVTSRWLLNLSRMVAGDYPQGVPEPLRLPKHTFAPEQGFPHWINRAPQLGIDRIDLAGGAIMDDFDGDGLLDLISSTADPCDGLKAFRNAGDGGFEDVSEAWGLSTQLGGLNLVHADYDGDGRLDLLILRGGWLGANGRIRNSLLRNELASPARGFVDVTRAAGLAQPHPTQAAAWADFDSDGDLDLYVANESSRAGIEPASHLFRNEGDGRFTDVASEAGVENRRYAKGAAWGDIDGDGHPDLYVSNLGPNRLYRNQGNGRFVDVAPELSVTRPEGQSFATWFFDYDNDGLLDLFVADYDASGAEVMASYMGDTKSRGHPVIYRNTGTGFEDVSSELGFTRPLLPMGANYGDIDSDGWLDVYLGTGDPRYETLVPNVMLRNQAGESFAEVTFAGGFGHLQKGHGVAFGDIDNDGDSDLFHQLGGFFPGDAFGNALFENPGSDANWITLRLEGKSANRFGVGARISVRIREPEGHRTIHLLAGSGGSFGGSSMQQEIGLGAAEAIEWIRIEWPGGRGIQEFRDVPMNHIYLAVEGDPELTQFDVLQFKLGGGGSVPHSDHRTHHSAHSPSEGG